MLRWFVFRFGHANISRQVRSGQVWGHTPEQRVATSTLRRYSFVLRLAITQVDARPVMSIILQIGLRLGIAQADARPVMFIYFR